jgi:hypothetical protein
LAWRTVRTEKIAAQKPKGLVSGSFLADRSFELWRIRVGNDIGRSGFLASSACHGMNRLAQDFDADVSNGYRITVA